MRPWRVHPDRQTDKRIWSWEYCQSAECPLDHYLYTFATLVPVSDKWDGIKHKR